MFKARLVNSRITTHGYDTLDELQTYMEDQFPCMPYEWWGNGDGGYYSPLEAYVIPLYCVHYLEYGYSDTLSDKEIEKIENFLKDGNGNYALEYVDSDYENPYFKWGNDMDNMGGDVVLAKFKRIQ